jgi:hypothetical protein
MRKISGAALALILAGCATTSPAPQATAFGTGTYKLIAVENQALPEVLSEGPQAGSEVIFGELHLNGDRTFRMRLDLRAQVSSLQPLTYTRNQSGTFDSSPMGVTLNWAGGSAATGAFFGRTLRVYRDGVEYLFMQ